MPQKQSEKSPEPVKPPKIDFAVGGQAVIEGVMMRSPNFITVAVRKSKGDIKLKDETFRALSARIKFFGIPIIRGVINLFEMMIIGMRILNFSAAEAMDEEEKSMDPNVQQSACKENIIKSQLTKRAGANTETCVRRVSWVPTGSKSRWRKPLLSTNSSEGGIVGGTSCAPHEKEQGSAQAPETASQKIKTYLSFGFSLIFALGMSLFLFKFLPLFITDFLSKNSALLRENYLVYNLMDGVIKMTFFVTYIALLGMTSSMHRVFQYHGAEHKSIYTYEKGLPLNVENAKKMTRFHPRCGTSFILVVFLLSIFIYTFVPKQPIFWVNFLTRVAFLPIIAGVSYEILKWSAKHAEKPLVRLITLPGLLFQRITTQEPDESQLEVALSALRKALELEEQKLAVVQEPDIP